MKISLESIINFFKQIFKSNSNLPNYPEMTVEPKFEEKPKNKAKKYRLKFEGEKEQKVPRSMRRKCKKQLPLPDSIKKKLRV